jgi:hypothetical protein
MPAQGPQAVAEVRRALVAGEEGSVGVAAVVKEVELQVEAEAASSAIWGRFHVR